MQICLFMYLERNFARGLPLLQNYDFMHTHKREINKKTNWKNYEIGRTILEFIDSFSRRRKHMYLTLISTGIIEKFPLVEPQVIKLFDSLQNRKEKSSNCVMEFNLKRLLHFEWQMTQFIAVFLMIIKQNEL